MGSLVKEVFKHILESQIFIDREKLRPDYIPDELPHREEQLNRLAKILAPALIGARPSNVFIYGLTGTGKTAVCRYVLNQIKDELAKRNIGKELITAYINCRQENTNYRVLVNLCEAVDQRIPSTGLSASEVFQRFMKALERRGCLAFVVLDEVDALVKKSGDEILYRLTRINSELRRSKVSIVGITNDLNFMGYLDPRVKSSLGEEEMVFNPYTAPEIEDILRQRADMAFKKGVLSLEVIPLCAALAAKEHGDARRALDLLRIAGEIAERENSSMVGEGHVRTAHREMERDQTYEVLKAMPIHSKLVAFGIYFLEKKGSLTMTGEIYNAYRKLCGEVGIEPLTQRRVSDLINDLDMLGLINARVVSKGRYGRTKVVRISVSEKSLRDSLQEDPRLATLLSLKT